MSNDDQEDHAKEAVAELWSGPVQFHVIAAKAKGERLHRPELEQIEAAYRSRQFDLFVFDDLSRLIRGGDAARLLGVGVDHGTRTICLNDGIDTIDSCWEQDSLNACGENVGHNEATSKRIKQKSMNRFRKFGQPTGRPIAGYIVPEGVKSYDGWLKSDEATPMIQKGFALLEQHLDGALVADFFNEHGFPTGPYMRIDLWDGAGVLRFFRNSLLKGKPQRGAKHTVKHHESGRRRSVTNPKGPCFYSAPHLAHVAEQDFDRLNVLLDAANEYHRRHPNAGLDPLSGRHRGQSKFPGLHARCWYCGFRYIWGANGQAQNLMCENSRLWHCWHSVGFAGREFSDKVVAAICTQLAQLEQFDSQFASLVEAAQFAESARDVDGWQQLERDEAELACNTKNVTESIKACGPDPMLKEILNELQIRRRNLISRRHDLAQNRNKDPRLPRSPADLRKLLQEEFQRLARESQAFAKHMLNLVPEIYVHAVRLCDGGHLLPRARVKLNLGGPFPDSKLVPGLADLLVQNLTVDVFEPPQRERIRAEVVALAADGLTAAAIAARIAERPSVTAVQNALALQRKMVELKLASPYVELLEPPADYPKLRRHKHPRYKFSPLDGYRRPPLV